MGKFGKWLGDNSGSIIGSLIGVIGNGIISEKTNKANLQQIKDTNKTNMAIADKANELTREESEKAYQRSMPANEVQQLRSAGMSKAGAINTLNGGASYTPAAVNVAQAQAGQVDNSALMSSISDLANVGQMIDRNRQWRKEFEASRQDAANAQSNVEKDYNLRKEAADRDNRLKDLQIINAEIQTNVNQIGAEARKYQKEYVEAYNSIPAGDYADIRDMLPQLKEKLSSDAYNALVNDSHAYDMIAGWIKRDNIQLGETSDVEVKLETQGAVVQKALNEANLSDKRLIEMDKKLKQMDLDYRLSDIVKAQTALEYRMQQDTFVSAIDVTNARNIAEAAKANLEAMQTKENTDAYKRLSPSEKDKWADVKIYLQATQDDADAVVRQAGQKAVEKVFSKGVTFLSQKNILQ